MSDKYDRFRTLADYRRFLEHPAPIIRGWAAECLKVQYPDQAADSFVNLLTDGDHHLQITAVQTLGESGGTRFEPALLAVWPGGSRPVHNWLTWALGRLRSAAILPALIDELKGVSDRPVTAADETSWLPAHSAAEALGHYPDEAARTALWHVLERYPLDDRLTFNVVEGLLRFIQPEEVARLVQRWGQLDPVEGGWWRISQALAQAAGLEGLVGQLLEPLAAGEDALLDFLEFWFWQKLLFSEDFLDALERAAGPDYADLWSHLPVELKRVAAERRDDLAGWLAAWQRGEPLVGYRWRMLYAQQLLTALAEHPPPQPGQRQEGVALGLALLAQALVDQDDEAALQAAPHEMLRQATLLSILGSSRPNVMPGLVEQVAALGPAVVPHLVDILVNDNIWAWLRALPALEQIARTQPGAADAAVPAILDLMHEEQDDEVLELASSALIAIGSGAVAAIGERLGQDYTYDIFAGNALAHIPTEASATAWLAYVVFKDTLEEYELGSLTDLGHPAAIPWLRDNFDWRNDPQLCTALYTLAVVTDYEGPELKQWQTVAVRDYQAYVRAQESGQFGRLVAEKGRPPVKKKKKQKRKRAIAQRKKGQKKKRGHR